MKLRDIKELHTKTKEELRTMLKETAASLSSAELEHAQRKLTNTTSLSSMRADIARIKTVLHMKMAETVSETIPAEGGKV